ncbi:hypothetical protein JQ628_00620 [Bradyrhizobium lablabi]|uniref:hypothetical protein n=1 Tax=Bradyrhizobium lablabi TaxID=722472 RepID=UPI001BA79F96|nr:hypothetical protein [Bradyrhizobium lablabi]MBR1119998.1 hypothetical protein [Bradyrhizobium lablabi]
MLRYDYLPSDFNPMFLFLGERQDLQTLADLLRSFAGNPRPLDVREQLTAAKSRTTLHLVPIEGDAGDFGMKQERDGFRWGLNAWQAEKIAERIELLTSPERKSGSDIIELGVEGEIPVKVSLGEFTDDFLVQRF